MRDRSLRQRLLRYVRAGSPLGFLFVVVCLGVVATAFGARENCHDNGARCHGLDQFGSVTDNVVHSHYTDKRSSGARDGVHLYTRRGTGPQGNFTGWKELDYAAAYVYPGDHFHRTVSSDAAECRTFLVNLVTGRWQYSHSHHYWCG